MTDFDKFVVFSFDLYELSLGFGCIVLHPLQNDPDWIYIRHGLVGYIFLMVSRISSTHGALHLRIHGGCDATSLWNLQGVEKVVSLPIETSNGIYQNKKHMG